MASVERDQTNEALGHIDLRTRDNDRDFGPDVPVVAGQIWKPAIHHTRAPRWITIPRAAGHQEGHQVRTMGW